MRVQYILFLVLFVPVLGFGTACQDPVVIRLRSAQGDCVGQRAEFEVIAENTVSYQWQASHPSTPESWFDLTFESTNTSTLSFVTDMVWNHFAFRCKLTGPCSEIYTSKTWIFVYQPGTDATPVIVFSSGSRSAPENSTVKLEIKVDQQHTNWGYQWQYSPSASGDWINLSGEVENELYITTFPDRDGYRYRCMVRGCPSVFSAVTTLSVTPSAIPNNYNYIKEITYLKQSDEYIDVDDRSVKISYFDGLGRGKQIVNWRASPLKRDIVQPVIYDKYGREARKYLRFANEQTNGYYFFNHLIIDASGDYSGSADAFFAQGSDNMIADDEKPWAETVFEPSPENRVIKQAAPGSAWQPDKYVDDHTTRYNYTTNVEHEVLLWEVVGNGCKLSDQVYYDFKELYLTETKDENWRSTDGDNGVVKEYRDKQGRIVLKRIYQSNLAHDTYYVYDHLNNLRFVLPPEASERMKQLFVSGN